MLAQTTKIIWSKSTWDNWKKTRSRSWKPRHSASVIVRVRTTRSTAVDCMVTRRIGKANQWRLRRIRKLHWLKTESMSRKTFKVAAWVAQRANSLVRRDARPTSAANAAVGRVWNRAPLRPWLTTRSDLLDMISWESLSMRSLLTWATTAFQFAGSKVTST